MPRRVDTSPLLPPDFCLLSPYVYWLGAILNAIILGLGAWLVLIAPVWFFISIRRYRRSRRSACLTCGYNLHAAPASSERCPECGSSMVIV